MHLQSSGSSKSECAVSMSFDAQILRDATGFPYNVTLTDRGRKATLIYSIDKGFKIKGVLTPKMRDALRLIYPYAEPSTLEIPEPLQTMAVFGGKTIFYDDMEGLIKWAGTGASKDNTGAFNGSNCLKVNKAAGVGTEAQGYRTFPLPPSKKVGLSCVWGCADFSKINSTGIQFWLDANVPPNLSTVAKIKYDPNTKLWYYIDDAGNFQTIEGHDTLLQYDVAWHSLKLIVDFLSKKYVSLQVDDEVFDLVDFGFVSLAIATTKKALVTFDVNADAANVATCYFDDVLLTEEP